MRMAEPIRPREVAVRMNSRLFMFGPPCRAFSHGDSPQFLCNIRQAKQMFIQPLRDTARSIFCPLKENFMKRIFSTLLTGSFVLGAILALSSPPLLAHHGRGATYAKTELRESSGTKSCDSAPGISR